MVSLSPDKTEITTYEKGYQFLGFFLPSRSRRVRDKSVQKFKAKVRELTIRKHNLDQKAIEKLVNMGNRPHCDNGEAVAGNPSHCFCATLSG